jgi:acetokinase family protein
MWVTEVRSGANVPSQGSLRQHTEDRIKCRPPSQDRGAELRNSARMGAALRRPRRSSALDGADAIVFTAGIGEHARRMRESILAGMESMGVHLDREANRAGARIVSADASPTIVYVIPTDEERMIAEHTVATTGLAKSGRSAAD